jgi:hypothetical protein
MARLAHHLRKNPASEEAGYKTLNKSRAMIMRWISLVPS